MDKYRGKQKIASLSHPINLWSIAHYWWLCRKKLMQKQFSFEAYHSLFSNQISRQLLKCPFNIITIFIVLACLGYSVFLYLNNNVMRNKGHQHANVNYQSTTNQLRHIIHYTVYYENNEKDISISWIKNQVNSKFPFPSE